MSPICVATALRGAWAEHEQNKSALRGMLHLHTPIYLAMITATQIGVCKRSLRQLSTGQKATLRTCLACFILFFLLNLLIRLKAISSRLRQDVSVYVYVNPSRHKKISILAILFAGVYMSFKMTSFALANRLVE